MSTATAPPPGGMELAYEDVLAEACRRSLPYFVRTFWGQVPGAAPLVWNWHIDELCDRLQEVAERVFLGLPVLHDLIFNVPPGTSKSTVCSILFPAWIWTRMPSARILSASHTNDLVMDLATKARAVITGELYHTLYPEVQLTDDQDVKTYYRNTAGGDRYTCTVSGRSPMGFHAHFHLCDDLLNPKTARSQVEVLEARKFLTEELPTRKVDKAVTPCILIMQRLCPGDPTDVMVENARKDGATPVERVTLPAEESDRVHPPELRARYRDGLLDPRRLSKAVLKRERARMTAHAYEAQYGQNPVPPGGSMFKPQGFTRFVRSAPYESRRVFAVDRACLVGGTLVETERGSVPIEDVVVGDRVLTRDGYRIVKRSWLTKYVEPEELVTVRFGNGSSLTGTGDHPVWTEGRGWVSLVTLDGGCYNVCLTDDWRGGQWRGAETDPGRTQGSPCFVGSAIIAGPATDTFGAGGSRYIGRCGSTTTETSRPAASSTTGTRTWITTTSPIWNVSPGVSTVSGIRTCYGARRSRCDQSARPRPAGGLPPRCTNTCARCAARSVSQLTLTGGGYSSVAGSAASGIGSVSHPRRAPSVRLSSGGALGHLPALKNARSHSGGGSVPSATVNLRSRRNHKRTAQNLAGPLTSTRNVAVYDLEVEGAHEFFANGILVHNSTADGGCFTAGVLMAKGPDGRAYVEDVMHGQWEPDERNDRIVASMQRYRRRYGKHEPRCLIESEGGASGVEAGKSLVRRLAGFKVTQVHVTGKKDVRAEPWADYVASGNVYIVDNGESLGLGQCLWDIQGFIDEHVRFRPEPGKRLGGFKDRVDACSLAFNHLFQGRETPAGAPLRVISFGAGGQRNGPPVKFVVVPDPEELGSLVIHEPALLIHCCDPSPLGEPPPGLPAHALEKLAGSAVLSFADLEASELQDVWDRPLEGFGRLPEQVLATKEVGRRMWGLLLKRHDPAPRFVLFTGEGGSDRRPWSAALAACDALGYRREQVFVSLSGDEGGAPEDPPNRFAYDVLRAARAGLSA